MDAEIGANSAAGLECFPLLGEAWVWAGAIAWLIFCAEGIHDGRVRIDAGGKRLKFREECGREWKRLVHVALGVEGHSVLLRVVGGRRDAGGGAVPDAEIGAEEQEESQRRRGGVEDLTALVVGGDRAPCGGLHGFWDGVRERGAGESVALQPEDEAAETLRVSGASVLRVASAPGVGGGLDVVSGQLRREFAAVRFGDRVESGTRVRVVCLRPDELLGRLGDSGGRADEFGR